MFIRKKFYRENFRYIAPIDVILGQKDGKDAVFPYVTILQTLKALLKDEHKRKALIRNLHRKLGFSQKACNPLGRKIHKVSGVYFTLGNFPPHCQLKLDQIQLVA